jgi:hypothetical protein
MGNLCGKKETVMPVPSGEKNPAAGTKDDVPQGYANVPAGKSTAELLGEKDEKRKIIVIE